jgi:hypothetical protein
VLELADDDKRQPQNKGTRMPETAYATDHIDAAPTARDHQTALRRQILAILPEIELFIIAFDCGLNPRSRRTKPALITWLLPHWREAEPHVFAFLDRAKHDPIREAWLGEGVDLPPVHPAETPEERARLLRKLTPRDRVMIENIVEQTGMTVAEACRRVDVIDGLPGYDAD